MLDDNESAWPIGAALEAVITRELRGIMVAEGWMG